MKKTRYSITQGVYVLGTNGSNCIVDAVSQVSGGDNPLIAVAVMKSNYTNEMMNNNDKFSLSILPKDIDGSIIKTFGFNSSRDIYKYENVKYTEVDNLKLIEDSIGYMICEKVNTVDTDTHTLFIGRLIKEERFNDKEELSYGYYQDHKDEYVQINVGNKTVWVCELCGYVYEGEELPEDFTCPKCGAGKEYFKKK